MTRIENECGTCGAAPYEACRSLRATGTGGGGTGLTAWGDPSAMAHIKTLHPWRGHKYDDDAPSAKGS